MTIDLRNFKSGDRVRATNQRNTDTAEFTVDSSSETLLYSATNVFNAESWDFTLIEPPKPKLPKVAGVYRLTPGKFGDRHLILTTVGSWYWIDFTTAHKNDGGFVYQGEHIKESVVKKYAGELHLQWAY